MQDILTHVENWSNDAHTFYLAKVKAFNKTRFDINENT